MQRIASAALSLVVKSSLRSYDGVITSPFGLIGFRMRGGALAEVDLRPRSGRGVPPLSPAARNVASALQRYFQDPAYEPRLELDVRGTPFQQRVWRALTRIAPGTTLTYGALAQALGTSARAVGGACRRNPVPIVVPCHRVVAAGGEGGFMGRCRGRALEIKSWLLRHEARLTGDECDREK